MTQDLSFGPDWPTPYADLNKVLAELTRRQRAAFGDNLIGVYLQGSFAVGDFDLASDVDLLFAVDRDLSPAEIETADALHAAIFQMPIRWARHLEGSYIPRAILRRWSPTPRDPPGEAPRPDDWQDPETGAPPRGYPVLYLNNGATHLVRSEHDNTLVVRWVTREHGVPLFGPPARDLIDPVDPEALKTEVRAGLLDLNARWIEDPAALAERWLPAFFVTWACRILQTLETGEVRSKKAATAWGKAALEKAWADTIEDAWSVSREPIEDRLMPADAAEIGRAQDFLRYARALASAPEGS